METSTARQVACGVCLLVIVVSSSLALFAKGDDTYLDNLYVISVNASSLTHISQPSGSGLLGDLGGALQNGANQLSSALSSGLDIAELYAFFPRFICKTSSGAQDAACVEQQPFNYDVASILGAAQSIPWPSGFLQQLDAVRWVTGAIPLLLGLELGYSLFLCLWLVYERYLEGRMPIGTYMDAVVAAISLSLPCFALIGSILSTFCATQVASLVNSSGLGLVARVGEPFLALVWLAFAAAVVFVYVRIKSHEIPAIFANRLGGHPRPEHKEEADEYL